MTITFEVVFGAAPGNAVGSAWYWAHDVLGKPVGFFGTIFFAIIIEKQGVPILNTVSLWIDSIIDLFAFINNKAIIPFLALIGITSNKKATETNVNQNKESEENKEKTK